MRLGEKEMTAVDQIVEQLNTSPQEIDVMASNIIREYHAAATRTAREKIAREAVERLAYLIFSFPYSFSESVRLFRGRPVPNQNCCFDRGSAFLAPPPEDTGAGRANRPGAPVLYASGDLDTVIEELRGQFSNPNEFVAFNHCEVRPQRNKKAYVVPVGEIDHIRRFGRSILPVDGYQEFMQALLGRLRDDVRRAAQLADAFFADEFQKPDSGEAEQYALTAAVADEFYADGRLDGILYPSVAHKGGINVAIKPASFRDKFEVVEYEASEILRYLGYGIAARRRYATARSLNEQGQVGWVFSPHGNAKICIPDNGKH